MITRADVIACAREWIGTRWQHQASLRAVGCDCIGLVGGVARELDLPGGIQWTNDPGIRGYGREPDPQVLLWACGKYLDPGAGVVGDILLLRAPPANTAIADVCKFPPRHFGIASRPGYMIHAWAQLRKVSENRIDEFWRARIVGFYSYRGLSNG
jgi:cell wall-associated NlpC family hydrolase